MDDDNLMEVVHQVPEAMDTEVPAIQELSPSVPPQEETKGMITSAAPESNERKGQYTWRIPGFVHCSFDKLYSECFEIGTYIWRLLIFPKGRDGNLAVYLDAPEASSTPVNLSPSAAFKLVVVNHTDPSKSFMKETSHTFDVRETDWGFTQFMLMDELLAPNSPYLTQDGALELRVEIQVQPDPRYAYDSRKETGFVGLKNQGATCYMNSLVQYLYMLPYFRKAVYHMPTVDSDDPKRNMPLALQRLFFKLQYSKTSVSTKDLTASFGWSTYDAFLQHDAHELNRVLCEKLEDKMKGTKVERTNQELFEGQILNYLKCLNVDYTSERKESYMDLQLNVRGCKDVYESFNKYIEEEMMDGANQYNAEGHGLQDAKKGVLFDSFPPVLQLHLKRFEYDFQRDVSTKVNDRYEFFDELDLDIHEGRFLSPKADRTVRNRYKLFAVLVHQGGSGGGHYYAYMRPDGKTWYKFDDERVTLEDAKAAMEGQFGGEDEAPGMGFQQHLRRAAPSNAYMLVYVRCSDWDKVFCPVTKDDLNVHLLRRLEQELAEKDRKQKEKMEAHMFITVKVATDADIRQQLESSAKAFDLVDHDQLPEANRLRLRKHTNFSEVKRLMAERFQVPPEKQRYWAWGPRPNGTQRATRVLRPEEESAKLLDLKELRELSNSTAKHTSMDIRLYLELPGRPGVVDPSASLYERTNNETLTFFKVYYPETERIRYIGMKHLPLETTVQDVLDTFHAKNKALGLGLPEEGPLELWEEVKWCPTVVAELCNPNDVICRRYNDVCMDGDIFIVQRAVSEQEANTLKRPNVATYLSYLRDRRLVNFRQLSDPKEEGFTLELWQDFPYTEVTLALARKLGLEPPEEGAAKIRLTTYNVYVNGPQRQPLRYKEHAKLTTMLHGPGMQHQQLLPGGAAVTDILYYEVLDMPLEQMEQLKTYKVYFHKESTEQGSEHTVRVQREGTVADVLDQLAQQLGPTAQQRVLRLMEVHSSKLYKILEPTDPIEQVEEDYWRLRAEFVPQDELSMQEGERLLHCYHISRKALGTGPDGATQLQPAGQQPEAEQGGHQVSVRHNLFGDPFVMKIGRSEELRSLKQRIKAKLKISDEEFGQWRFWLWSPRGGFELLSEDTADIAAKLPKEEGVGFTDTPYLGMEHRDDKPFKQRQSQYPSYQRPIKINA